MKEIEASLQTKIDEALAPVRELATRAEMAQVEQLEPEEQAEYWKKKATSPAPSQSAQSEAQPQAQPQQAQAQPRYQDPAEQDVRDGVPF